MNLDDLIGPIPAPLGRWMLRRLVAGGVRYGREFSVLLIEGAEPEHLARLLRGADVFSHWDGGALLALLPDTDRAGGVAAAQRIREATGARIGTAHWAGHRAEEMLERAADELAADVAQG